MQDNKKFRPAILLLSSLSSLSLVPVAFAAQAAGADDNGMDIIVTAQRQEQRLQDVPISVSAFSADQLEASNVVSVQDIATRTPGLAVAAYDPVSTNYAIRGIGSPQGIAANAGGDQSVVVFIDGVYIGRGGLPDLDSMDLERVEVLRGPQGTLFGKNAIGGLIQFVSRKPTAEPSFRASLTGGNYNLFGVSARGNAVLGDGAYLSVGLSHKRRDGYEYNETTGNDVNDLNLTSGRVALRLVPVDALDIVLRADITHQDQRGNPRHNNCNSNFNGGVHCVGVNPDPRVVNAYIDGYARRGTQSYSAEIAYDLGFGTLTSLTAFRRAKFGTQTVFFSNPVNPPTQIESTNTIAETGRQFTQELRLALSGMDDRLNAQFGLFYMRDRIRRSDTLQQDFAAPSMTGISTYPQLVKARSFALFGQADFELAPSLTATAGARMTWERKEGQFGGFLLAGPGIPPPFTAAGDYDVHASRKWKAFTPRFALNWKAADNVLLFASASKGFKSGGFQGIAGNAAGARLPFDPEYAWGYEIGAKTDLLDRRLRLNLSAFQTDYSNLQVSQLDPLCCVRVNNAAEARLRGVEVEFMARPVRGFQIDGSYAYLDSKLLKYNVPGQAYAGNRLPRAPRHKFNIGGQVEFPLGEASGRLRVDYAYQSDAYFEASNIAQQRWPSHNILDARFSINLPGDQIEVSLWGKNLTNALVPTYVTWFGPFQQQLVPWAPPRTYGATLSFRL